MPAKKLTAKKPSKKSSVKRTKIAVLIDPPVSIASLANAGRRTRPKSSKKIKVVRNPWIPDDIIILIKFVLTYGAGKYLFELIKIWMEYRKAQKIEIKVGEYELKIEGQISDKAIEKKFAQFRELIKEVTYDDIKVTLPKGANRNIPAKLADRKAKKIGEKKP
jgi:hypothetical protein